MTIMKKLFVIISLCVYSMISMAQGLATSVYQPLPPTQSRYPSTADYAIGLLRGDEPDLNYGMPPVTRRAEPQTQTFTVDAYYITKKGDLSKINVQVTVDVYGAHLSAVYNRNTKTWSKESHPIYEITQFDNEFIYNNFEFKSSTINYGTIYF